MLQIKRIAKQLLNSAAVMSIHVIRYVHYWFADRSPVLEHLDISDRVLVNDRIIRISYSCANVTHVYVKGIISSHRHTNELILKVPEKMSVIEVIFYGVREKIAERTTLIFLTAELQKGHLRKTLQRPALLRMNNVVPQLIPFKMLHVAQVRKLHARKILHVKRANLNVTIIDPQIEKSTDL